MSDIELKAGKALVSLNRYDRDDTREILTDARKAIEHAIGCLLCIAPSDSATYDAEHALAGVKRLLDGLDAA